MSRAVTLVLAGAVALTGVACAKKGEKRATAEADRIAAAQDVLVSFRQDLVAALTEGLAQGPEAAIEACRVRAPEIASAYSTDSVRVGRTSHRLRNPDNAPEPWIEPILRAYADGREKAPYRTVVLDDGSFAYVEPLYVAPMCTTCHGVDIPAPLRERIAGLYPDDRAIGFEAGDFRGLAWVTISRGNGPD